VTRTRHFGPLTMVNRGLPKGERQKITGHLGEAFAGLAAYAGYSLSGVSLNAAVS
jgi:hypothetical protein